AVPPGGPRAGRLVRAAGDPALARLQRRAGAAHLSLLDLVSRVAVRRAAGGPLPAGMAGLTRRRGAAGAAVLTLALASAFIAGCDRAPGGGPAFKAIDVSGADFGRELALLV